MKDSLLALLCCPKCRGPFKLSRALSEGLDVVQGELACLGCGLAYPIVDGLPVILEKDVRSKRTLESFGREWTLHAQGRFEGNTVYGRTEEEDLQHFKGAFNLPHLKQLEHHFVLDAGCGSGRLTAALGRIAQHSTIVGLDFSDAAKAAYLRCKDLPNVHIVQSDLLRPPFRTEAFDYVWSVGVLHHALETERGFGSIANLVKPGGRIYIWIYSSRVFTPYRFTRKVLSKPYLLPPGALYRLSWGLAVPLYCFHKIREFAGITQVCHRLKSIAFSFYDVLSPEFMRYHSEEEVRQWFQSNGFDQIRFLPQTQDIGASAVKKGVAESRLLRGPGLEMNLAVRMQQFDRH